LLSFGEESFVFPFAFQKYKAKDAQNYNFVRCFVWVCNLVAHIGEERRLRVFENRVLRGVFGLRRDEVTGDCRKPRIEELKDLYCSPNIFRVIKSRRMRWAGHVAHMQERRVQGFGGEPCGKQTTWKTKAQLGR